MAESKAEAEHRIETSWTFYYHKKIGNAGGDFKEFQKALINLGSFDTVEGSLFLLCFCIPFDCYHLRFSLGFWRCVCASFVSVLFCASSDRLLCFVVQGIMHSSLPLINCLLTITTFSFENNTFLLGRFVVLRPFLAYSSFSSFSLFPSMFSLLSYFRLSQSFPTGGCWIIKVRKRNGAIARLWEELVFFPSRSLLLAFLFFLFVAYVSLIPAHIPCSLFRLCAFIQCFACVGELFEEPDLVGVSLSSRLREDILTVWNRDNSRPDVRFKIGSVVSRLISLIFSFLLHFLCDFLPFFRRASSSSASIIQFVCLFGCVLRFFFSLPSALYSEFLLFLLLLLLILVRN